MSLANLNLQPLLDLLGKAGDETSEFKKARAAGRIALVLFAIGLVTMLAGAASNVFGANSKVGVAAGALSAIAAVIANAMTSMGYSAARADAKTAAATVVAAAQAPTDPMLTIK